MVVSYWQVARAGYSVNVSATTGKGTVTATVTSHTADSVTGLKPRITFTTPFMVNPSVAINQQSNSFPSGSLHSDILFAPANSLALPAGSDARTYVQVRATSNYWASVQSTNLAGDLGDSDDLIGFIIPRSACASSDVEIVPIQTTANSIKFQFKAKLSDEGSAVLLRVVETNSTTGLPIQKYVVLVVGPYDNTAPGNCEGTVTVTGDLENMALLLDGHTSTLPFNISCPADQVLSCSAPLPATYDPPAVASGDTGPYTITYDKLPADLAIGNNVVTATARDANGCTVSCQFNVNRQGITFNGFFSPIGSADGPACQAVRSYRLGSNVALKFKMTCNGQEVLSGTPVITIERCGGNVVFHGPFQHVNDEWHFNIDSSVVTTAGTYTFIATLPDGSQHSTVIQFTKK